MTEACPPPGSPYVGDRLAPYIRSHLHTFLIVWSILSTLVCVALTMHVPITEDVVRAKSMALLLLAEVAKNAGALCTDVLSVCRFVCAYGDGVSSGAVIVLGIGATVRYVVKRTLHIERLKRHMHEMVLDKFAECPKCAHKRTCVFATYQTFEALVVKVRAEMDLDLRELQTQARFELARCGLRRVKVPS